MSDKKKKVMFATIFCLVGAIVVLLAIASIATLFTHNFLASMNNKVVRRLSNSDNTNINIQKVKIKSLLKK